MASSVTNADVPAYPSDGAADHEARDPLGRAARNVSDAAVLGALSRGAAQRV